MISFNYAKEYCSEPLENIENYQQAVEDDENQWDCHHRLEITPTGTRLAKELEAQGLYWNRPASELIFLPHIEHRRIHMMGNRNKMYGKRGEDAPCYGRNGDKHPMFGKHHSDEVRKTISRGLKGKYTGEMASHWGKHWYTDGKTNILTNECPPGFRRGRICEKSV